MKGPFLLCEPANAVLVETEGEDFGAGEATRLVEVELEEGGMTSSGRVENGLGATEGGEEGLERDDLVGDARILLARGREAQELSGEEVVLSGGSCSRETAVEVYQIVQLAYRLSSHAVRL